MAQGSFIDCDTPLSPVSPGECTHLHTYHGLCVCNGHTSGRRNARTNYRIQKSHFVKEKVRKKSGEAFAAGFLSINFSADYPGTKELNVMQIHR